MTRSSSDGWNPFAEWPYGTAEEEVSPIVSEIFERAGDPRRVPVFDLSNIFRTLQHDTERAFFELRSERDAATMALERADEHCRLLQGEIRHRVKNTLTVVASIISQSLKKSSDVSSAARSISARISALSAAYDLLYSISSRSPTIEEIVASVVDILEIEESRLDIHGPELLPHQPEVVSLSLVLHELMTNAMKYGALSTPDGKLKITWGIVRDRAVFRWAEAGGPLVTAPEREGFGTQLLTRALAGRGRRIEIFYLPTGVQWTFSSPLDGFASAPRGAH